jgi:hypothetical protein
VWPMRDPPGSAPSTSTCSATCALRKDDILSSKTGILPKRRSLNPHVARSAAIAAAGGLFGFDTAVIASTARALAAGYGLSAATAGFGFPIRRRASAMEEFW